MRTIRCCALIIHFTAGIASAQTFNDVQIELGVYRLRNHGGEKPLGVWLGTGAVVIGKSTTGTFSYGDTCDAFAVSSVKSDVVENATTAWHIEVTPIRVVRDAVTFRLRWVRLSGLRQQLDHVSLGSSKPIRNEEVELTLRPGESWPVDSVRVPPGAKTVHGEPCGNSASIRVLVNTHPWEEDDRRLVAADLWLIERLSNGSEAQRSQALSVRGLPNRPISFYFDSIVDANVPLDIYGTLSPRLEGGTMTVAVETRCRWGRSPDPGFRGPQQFVDSEVQVNSAEIVELRLPVLGKDAGPFAKREFSIRIRARQLR
jgi:hypothetical protein